MEFKKNRQAAILESIRGLKAPEQILRPGLFSDAKAVKALEKNLKQAEELVKRMRSRLSKIFEKPATYDPVYKVCQRVFHKEDALNLSRNTKVRHLIRRKAFRRFLFGCPPRKKDDTSIGDAVNWEWIVYCAKETKSHIVIVSRDSDYGSISDSRSYLNDHLKQEFAERVGKTRKAVLYTKLSEALKHFAITVTPKEEEEENRLIESSEKTIEATQRIKAKDVISINVEDFIRAVDEVVSEKR